MSVINVMTRDLVGILSDTILTVYPDPDEIPSLAAVLLDTAKADVQVKSEAPDSDELFETVPSDVLVGTSTDTLTMIGQAHAPCEGQFHRPVLVAVEDVKAVLKPFTDKARRAPKGEPHRTEVEVNRETITFREDRAQKVNITTVTVPLLDVSDYPRNLGARMVPDTVGEVIDRDTLEPVPASYGTGLRGEALEVITKVGKRRGMMPVFYRHHQRRPIVVEIGSMWRGLFTTAKLDEANGQHLAPLVRVFSSRLPERAETAPLDL